MKKTIIILLISIFFYGCSTSSDSNGNSNTTVVPLAPTNLTGQVISGTQINLSWIDNSTNETSFKIERKTSSGTFTLVGSTSADITTFIDTGLTQNTTYIYRVYSNNAGGNSLNYSNEITLLTLTVSVTDIDGNTYPVVYIGNQIWTKTNLNVSKYRNGDIIPQVTDATQWSNLTTGAWCYYANTNANGTTYGKLYNWYAVNDPRGLAPNGYHIPTYNELTTLNTFIGGLSGAMKETGTTHWQSPNLGATNTTGFTGLPGGYRDFIGGFGFINIQGLWWTSPGTPYALNSSNNGSLLGYTANQKVGCSVRCVKD
jgi:uncharacterized protein (TIGR02145 family)